MLLLQANNEGWADKALAIQQLLIYICAVATAGCFYRFARTVQDPTSLDFLELLQWRLPLMLHYEATVPCACVSLPETLSVFSLHAALCLLCSLVLLMRCNETVRYLNCFDERLPSMAHAVSDSLAFHSDLSPGSMSNAYSSLVSQPAKPCSACQSSRALTSPWCFARSMRGT